MWNIPFGTIHIEYEIYGENWWGYYYYYYKFEVDLFLGGINKNTSISTPEFDDDGRVITWTYDNEFGYYPTWYTILSFLWIVQGLLQAYIAHCIPKKKNRFLIMLMLISTVFCILQILGLKLIATYLDFNYVPQGFEDYNPQKGPEFESNVLPIIPLCILIFFIVLKTLWRYMKQLDIMIELWKKFRTFRRPYAISQKIQRMNDQME